ncbi:MAG: CBS domain-containing protein [Nitrospira sp.]|nr:CBS domain-containing protein [Nitrospira sp.]
MPIILSVNGIVETYPIKPVGPRNGRAESAGERGHHGRHSSSLDRSALAAQTAYQQQNSERPHPKPAILARDLMSAPVHSLPSDSTLLDAWSSMSHKGFHHIPITSMHDTLVGMVSYQDLLHHVPELITAADKRQASRRRLADIMTSRVVSATPVTEIRDIARVMLDERIHAVPILDHDRRVVGILAIRDLLQGLANHGPLELWT